MYVPKTFCKLHYSRSIPVQIALCVFHPLSRKPIPLFLFSHNILFCFSRVRPPYQVGKKKKERIGCFRGWCVRRGGLLQDRLSVKFLMWSSKIQVQAWNFHENRHEAFILLKLFQANNSKCQDNMSLHAQKWHFQMLVRYFIQQFEL